MQSCCIERMEVLQLAVRDGPWAACRASNVRGLLASSSVRAEEGPQGRVCIHLWREREEEKERERLSGS